MDALRIEKAILAGFDWGARTAAVMAALWPERCKALVSVSGYLIGSREANKMPLPPKAELQWWYQYYFATERGRAGYERYRRDFAKLIWQIASPKWEFDDISRTLGNRCAGRKIVFKLFFAFIAIKFCMKLIRRSQRRAKTSNCSSLVVVVVLRGLGQVIQFLLLGLAKISAASAGVNREHLLVRLRRGGLKVCGLQRGQHFRIVGISSCSQTVIACWLTPRSSS
jgi:hypothetical protein